MKTKKQIMARRIKMRKILLKNTIAKKGESQMYENGFIAGLTWCLEPETTIKLATPKKARKM